MSPWGVLRELSFTSKVMIGILNPSMDFGAQTKPVIFATKHTGSSSAFISHLAFPDFPATLREEMWRGAMERKSGFSNL